MLYLEGPGRVIDPIMQVTIMQVMVECHAGFPWFGFPVFGGTRVGDRPYYVGHGGMYVGHV